MLDDNVWQHSLRQTGSGNPGTGQSAIFPAKQIKRQLADKLRDHQLGFIGQ